MSVSRPRKILVYLDQNFISEMAKPSNTNVRADFKELYALLHGGFWNEQLVVLRSEFHDVETSLAVDPLKDAIKARRSMLGHVDLASRWKIRQNQIVAALGEFLGRGAGQPVIRWDEVFNDDPDHRLRHFDISVNMDWTHSDAKTERKELAAQLDKIRQRIRDDRLSYDEQYRHEMDGSRAVAMRPGFRFPYMAAADVTDAEYRRFVASDAYAEVPIVWLEVALLAKLMTAHAHRTVKQGDVTDIDAMATYLPYCDVYGADRLTANVARSLKVPERFRPQLFDSTKVGVGQLIEHLHHALTKTAPVNVPALSIFVAPEGGIKEHSFEFFRLLGNQARTAEYQLGDWVEIFGFDDGMMPGYGLAPFFGLQEVRVVGCAASDGTDALVRSAEINSRSRYFVIVDKYQELPNDFVSKALMSRGADKSVLGYRIYDCEADI